MVSDDIYVSILPRGSLSVNVNRLVPMSTQSIAAVNLQGYIIVRVRTVSQMFTIEML